MHFIFSKKTITNKLAVYYTAAPTLCNLEWRRGGAWLRTEGAIHLEGCKRIELRKTLKTVLWKCGFPRVGHQILVAVLVTLQHLVTI